MLNSKPAGINIYPVVSIIISASTHSSSGNINGIQKYISFQPAFKYTGYLGALLTDIHSIPELDDHTFPPPLTPPVPPNVPGPFPSDTPDAPTVKYNILPEPL